MRVTGRIWVGGVCACAALMLGGAAALAAPPAIDGSFGVEGVASTSFPPEAEIESFREIAPTPDGGVVTRSSYYEGTEVRHYGADGSLAKAEPEIKNGHQIEIEPAEAPASEGGRLVGVHTGEEGADAVERLRADGSPDPSFGTGGTSERLPFQVQAVAPLPAGKVLVAGKGILTAGGTKTEPTYQVYVARLGANGKIDEGFGKNGIVALQSADKVPGDTALYVAARTGGGAEVVVASAVVGLDSSGKLDPGFGKGGRVNTPGAALGAGTVGETLLVAGTRSALLTTAEGEEEAEGFYVARYTAAGALDTTYAGGPGIATLDPGGVVAGHAAVFGADGSAMIGGAIAERAANCASGYTCDRTPVVVRFGPGGTLDAGFGSGGIARLTALTVPVTQYSAGVTSLAARAGGGYFAAGDGLGATFVAALGANGTLDAGFGAGGLVTDGTTEPSRARPIETGVDAAGNVYALVETDSGTGLSNGTVVLRYTPAGALDTSYGEGGQEYVPPDSETLVVAPDGSVFLTTLAEKLVKLTPSGLLDTGFGQGGSVSLPKIDNFETNLVRRLEGGDLILAGDWYQRGRRTGAAVVRLHPDGKLDRSFGKDGIGTAETPRRHIYEKSSAVAIDGKGRIVVAGNELQGCCVERAGVFRFGRGGRLDRSFGHEGSTLFDGAGLVSVGGLATRGGRVFAATVSSGQRRTRDLVWSFTSAGRLDHRFGDDGVAVAPRGDRHEPFESVALFSTRDRLVLARSYLADPLVAFTPRGKLERGFARALGGIVPRSPGHSTQVTPAATLAGSDLFLAFSGYPHDGSKEASVLLRRVLLP